MFLIDASEERAAVVDLCRGLARDVLSDAGGKADRTGAIGDSVLRTLLETGLTVAIPEEFGGGGIPSCVLQGVAVEELAAGDAALTLASVWRGAGAAFISALGSPSQRSEWLPALASDPAAGLPVALFEGFGRGPTELTTVIGPTVSGSKLGVVAPLDKQSHGRNALVVIGRDSNRNLAAALVEVGSSGTSLNTGSGRIALGALGLCAATFNGANAEPLNAGEPEEIDLLVARYRLLGAVAMLGTARRSLEYASSYANERIAFGKPISTFQGVSFLLADNFMRVNVARLELEELAQRIDSQMSLNIHEFTTAAVNCAGVAATQATRDAIQVLGGHGFITDHPVELWYRQAIAMSVIDNDPLVVPFDPVF